MSDLRVAIVGLGQMGGGIARNVQAAGLLVAAFDIEAEVGLPVPMLRGQSMVDAADVILFATPSSAQVAGFLEGCTGQGTTIVDLTTSSPAQSIALAADLAPHGFSFIDAAMTGGAAGADAGTLTLMAGGDAGAIAVCQPVFKAISDQIFHLGPVGSGHAMKLVHNLILHSAFMATCEGLRLAERAGLDLTTAVDVLNAGNARSFVTEVRFPRDILSGTMSARSTIANLEKDLGLAVEFAASLAAPAPYSGLTFNLLHAAALSGAAGADFSNLFPMYDALAQRLEAEA